MNPLHSEKLNKWEYDLLLHLDEARSLRAEAQALLSQAHIHDEKAQVLSARRLKLQRKLFPVRVIPLRKPTPRKPKPSKTAVERAIQQMVKNGASLTLIKQLKKMKGILI